MATHVCPTCGRDDFARERDMKAHHTIAHEEKLVEYRNLRECPTCGEVFANEGGMRAHHKIRHAESIAESRSLARSVREQVIERDASVCQRCGADVTPTDEDGPDFQLHHIVPFSAGGPDHPDNLITLCSDCHGEAHQRMRRIVEERPDLLEELKAFACGPHERG
ncbi:HNH endonuclease [Halorubrum halodurans]|uniref:C2H2-type domain-containing protein n=1 Tax=Halorubrum halodurans TaxID=1383851 RepID=A0A256IEE6_9EURY|nr:HNH endonuclease [Halorubrum halodurans]OYR54921.1 hypothetical protein DJ70_12900 [Halorubrum halodurans]